MLANYAFSLLSLLFTPTDVYVTDNTFLSQEATNSVLDKVESCNVGTINVHINSHGGIGYLGDQLISTLKSSPCHVKVLGEGAVMSMASMLFFSFEDKQVDVRSLFAFHTGSTGDDYVRYVCSPAAAAQDGVSDSMKEDILSCYTWVMSRYFPLFTSVLTDEEEAAFALGKDVYVEGSEIKRRLESGEVIQ